jgi:hypothetical protein
MVITDTLRVQSLPVKIECDDLLYPGLKEFLDSLWKEDAESVLAPLNMVVKIRSSPPPIPVEASPVVETPFTQNYRLEDRYYYAAKDGSMVQFDLASRYCEGFIRPEIQNEMTTISSLVSSPLIETMRAVGRFYLHAAALHHKGIGYLICGDGGCGKTTSALNLVRSGFDYVSDDSLLLDNRAGVIRAYPWYQNFHLSEDICLRYDELDFISTVDFAEGEKISLDISRFFKGKPVKWINPDVILFPQICSRRTSVLSPLAPMDMFTRLIKQILLPSDPVLAKQQLDMLKRLVQSTCGFEVLGGKDLLEDPDKLSSLITDLPTRH